MTSNAARVGQPTPLLSLVTAEVERALTLSADAKAAERSADAPAPSLELEADRLLARIPKRFAKATVREYRTASDAQTVARTVVADWIRHAGDEIPPMLALVGETGVGKSHLLYAAARALIGQGMRPYVRGWYELADALRYGGRSAYGPGLLEPQEIRAQLHEATVVLLDEVRPTAGTAFDDTELAKAACAWYDRAIPVLITSNVMPLADVMGPPAASRFTQLLVTGPDFRQTEPPAEGAP
jgi:chromosomal replication initiation ATPase DnaA